MPRLSSDSEASPSFCPNSASLAAPLVNTLIASMDIPFPFYWPIFIPLMKILSFLSWYFSLRLFRLSQLNTNGYILCRLEFSYCCNMAWPFKGFFIVENPELWVPPMMLPQILFRVSIIFWVAITISISKVDSECSKLKVVIKTYEWSYRPDQTCAWLMGRGELSWMLELW